MIDLDPALDAPGAAPAAADGARAQIGRQMARLERLAEIGMDIAEACGREARAMTSAAVEAAAASPEGRHELGLVFARVARAVRMTIALQSRLMKDLAELDKADHLAAMRRKDERRFRLGRLAADAARASVDAQRRSGTRFWPDEEAIEDEIERLSDATYERLTDAEENLGDRPFDDLVAAICADLRLSPDWTARVTAAVERPANSVILGRSGGAAQTRGPSPTDVDESIVQDRSGWVLGSPPPRQSPRAPPEDDGEVMETEPPLFRSG